MAARRSARSEGSRPRRVVHALSRRVLFSCAIVGAALALGAGTTIRSGASGAEALEHAVVARVIDGDTIELASGEPVRYIGIDAPELRQRAGPDWVYRPEPYAEEAWAFNRRAVEGQTVRLEFDVERRDRFRRSLAYVRLGDRLINAELVAQGLADVLTVQPNTRYAELFRRAEREARAAHRGRWAEGGPAR